jgi:hypothetical protein
MLPIQEINKFIRLFNHLFEVSNDFTRMDTQTLVQTVQNTTTDTEDMLYANYCASVEAVPPSSAALPSSTDVITRLPFIAHMNFIMIAHDYCNILHHLASFRLVYNQIETIDDELRPDTENNIESLEYNLEIYLQELQMIITAVNAIKKTIEEDYLPYINMASQTYDGIDKKSFFTAELEQTQRLMHAFDPSKFEAFFNFVRGLLYLKCLKIMQSNPAFILEGGGVGYVPPYQLLRDAYAKLPDFFIDKFTLFRLIREAVLMQSLYNPKSTIADAPKALADIFINAFDQEDPEIEGKMIAAFNETKLQFSRALKESENDGYCNAFARRALEKLPKTDNVRKRYTRLFAELEYQPPVDEILKSFKGEDAETATTSTRTKRQLKRDRQREKEKAQAREKATKAEDAHIAGAAASSAGIPAAIPQATEQQATAPQDTAPPAAALPPTRSSCTSAAMTASSLVTYVSINPQNYSHPLLKEMIRDIVTIRYFVETLHSKLSSDIEATYLTGSYARYIILSMFKLMNFDDQFRKPFDLDLEVTVRPGADLALLKKTLVDTYGFTFKPMSVLHYTHYYQPDSPFTFPCKIDITVFSTDQEKVPCLRIDAINIDLKDLHCIHLPTDMQKVNWILPILWVDNKERHIKTSELASRNQKALARGPYILHMCNLYDPEKNNNTLREFESHALTAMENLNFFELRSMIVKLFLCGKAYKFFKNHEEPSDACHQLQATYLAVLKCRFPEFCQVMTAPQVYEEIALKNFIMMQLLNTDYMVQHMQKTSVDYTTSLMLLPAYLKYQATPEDMSNIAQAFLQKIFFKNLALGQFPDTEARVQVIKDRIAKTLNILARNYQTFIFQSPSKVRQTLPPSTFTQPQQSLNQCSFYNRSTPYQPCEPGAAAGGKPFDPAAC